MEKIGDPTGPQDCEIYQLNTTGLNNAFIQQQVQATSGSTQAATQGATIAQWNGSGSNTAQVNQDLKESTSATTGSTGTITQTQDGHQTASVSQHSDTGNNGAQVNQSLQLKASATGGTSITQNQDTDPSLGPNTRAAIYQNADENVSAPTSTGTNNAFVFQTNDLNASGSKTTNLSQQQGDPSTGIQSHVVQASTGVSTTQENQHEHQTVLSSQVTNPPSQVQYGPMWLGSPQGDNPADTFVLSQSSDQNSQPASPNQLDELFLNCDVIGGGTCMGTQRVSNDSQHGTNTCSDSSCNLSLTASSSPGEGGGVFTCSGDCSNGGEAPPPPPPNICDQIPNAPPCVNEIG
jgi:hypothetical protein